VQIEAQSVLLLLIANSGILLVALGYASRYLHHRHTRVALANRADVTAKVSEITVIANSQDVQSATHSLISGSLLAAGVIVFFLVFPFLLRSMYLSSLIFNIGLAVLITHVIVTLLVLYVLIIGMRLATD
jgi:hypothetical protein